MSTNAQVVDGVDEHDAAQERGEIRTQADNQAYSKAEKASHKDVGLSSKEVHDAREIRDAEQADPGKDHAPEAKVDFMLAALRRASASLRLRALELDEIGVSLKFGMITAEGAVSWIDYIGAVDIINTEPWPDRIAVGDLPIFDWGDIPRNIPSPEAAKEMTERFEYKMAPGGSADRILRGGA